MVAVDQLQNRMCVRTERRVAVAQARAQDGWHRALQLRLSEKVRDESQADDARRMAAEDFANSFLLRAARRQVFDTDARRVKE